MSLGEIVFLYLKCIVYAPKKKIGYQQISLILCVLIVIAHLPKIHQNNRKYNNNNTIPSPQLEGKDDF